MAIIIVDNFQVNIENPIDNRFVVGSQSIPSGSPSQLYPNPFYKYKDDITYKYPGLRVWDFNDGVPYVWTGVTWSNENTTGALIQGGGGHQNYIPKFLNNSTLLGRSKFFDNNTHIGLGLTSSTNPNSVQSYQTDANSGISGTITITFSTPPNGLHVDGNIKTNNFFSGDGRYIVNIHANNIRTGTLNLDRISVPNGININSSINSSNIGITYLMTNTTGVNDNKWALANSVVLPIIQSTVKLTDIQSIGTNALGQLLATGPTITNNGGTITNTYNFKGLISTGLDITNTATDIRLESKAGKNIGSSDGIGIYDETNFPSTYLSSNPYIHKFRKLKSNTLEISLGSGTDNGDVLIELQDNKISDFNYLKKSSQIESNAGVIDTVATTPLVDKVTFGKRVNDATMSVPYLASDSQNGLMSISQFNKLAGLINNVKNVGWFSGLDIAGTPTGTSFTTGGNITASVTFVSGSMVSESFILVTMQNAMTNTNYYVRSFIESQGTLNNDNDANSVVFKPISTTQYQVAIKESAGVGQSLKIHMEVVQLL